MMKKIITSIFLFFILAKSYGQIEFQKDFDFYWQTIKDNFAYFEKQRINWGRARNIYRPLVIHCKTKTDFIHLLEEVNNELYNGHIFLNTNTGSSNRTIPTGSDLKVKFENGNIIIDEIREGLNADLSGLEKGMRITKFNDNLLAVAMKRFLPKSADSLTDEMVEYAANMLLAGTHDNKRKITVNINGSERNYYPDEIPNKTEDNYSTLLEWKQLEKNLGYIKIFNSLGNQGLIEAFDNALDSLVHTDGLILDLRETPSGGNTSIARAIMGRFTNKETPYQKHIYIVEEGETGIKRSTLELVSPRKIIYRKPLVVLVGYWTGSMGEGITIGFNSMKRAKIAGTKMAGLLGEIYTFKTPVMKIPFSFPVVQLQTIDGQPRENYIPEFLVKDGEECIQAAMKLLIAEIKN